MLEPLKDEPQKMFGGSKTHKVFGCLGFICHKYLVDPNNLAKLQYFTNLDFPETMGFPFQNATFWGEIGRVRSRANLIRNYTIILGRMFFFLLVTLPKTNIATENRPSQNRKNSFLNIHFRVLLLFSFREGTWRIIPVSK